MTQVEYNHRTGLYNAELKRIAAKYRALQKVAGAIKDPDECDAECERLYAAEEAETEAVKATWLEDTKDFDAR